MTNDMAYGKLLPDQNRPKLQETRNELLDLQTGKLQENYARHQGYLSQMFSLLLVVKRCL